LKPENILLKDGRSVVGDFGICFIDDGVLTLTSAGQRGSRYYCPPELRGPKIDHTILLPSADVYSLGKVLYWIFTHDVYDGSEEDYSEVPERKLARLFPSYPQLSFIDELVAEMIRRKPQQRIVNAGELLRRVAAVVERLEAQGRVLDLRIGQKCLYCAAGQYQPAHAKVYVQGGKPAFPNIDTRREPDNPPYPDNSVYHPLRTVARSVLGLSGQTTLTGIPLLLICDYCGNVQYFRLDLTQDGYGKNWLP
jgi:serine/threonine protein kinase